MVGLMSDAHDAADPVPPGDGSAVHARLVEAREAARAQIVALSAEYEGIVEANALIAVDDEHDPEGSNTAFERAHVSALLDRTRDHLAAVDQALERLDRGTYGRCASCGEPIPPERLDALPATVTCVRCAAARPR